MQCAACHILCVPDRQNDAIKHTNLDNTFNSKETNATVKDDPVKTENLESKVPNQITTATSPVTAPDTPDTTISLVSTGQAANTVAHIDRRI